MLKSNARNVPRGCRLASEAPPYTAEWASVHLLPNIQPTNNILTTLRVFLFYECLNRNAK